MNPGYLRACASAAALIASSVTQAQTTVNNTIVNNHTTNVYVQPSRTVVVVNPAPRPAPAPYVPPAPSSFPYQPRELLSYMSPRCAQLYEVQLAGYSRRTSSSAASGLRDEFQTECPDAVSSAQKALYQYKLGKYRSAQDRQTAATTVAERDRQTQEQCNELLRILAGKRKRLATMTEGEREDHMRFEDNYKARCKS